MLSRFVCLREFFLTLKERSYFVYQIQGECKEDEDIDGIAGENSLYRLKHSYKRESEVLGDVGGRVNCYRSQQLHSNNTSNTYELPPPSSEWLN